MGTSLNNYPMKFSELFTSVFANLGVRYTSELSVEEVIARLEKNSAPDNFFNPLRNLGPKQYGGGVYGSKFKLEPHKFVFGNLKPAISGSIKPVGDRTIIEIELSSAKASSLGFGLIFILFWYLVFTLYSANGNWLLILIPPILMLIYLMFANRMYYETVHECCWDLAALCEGDPMEILD